MKKNDCLSLQRPPAELLYKTELDELEKRDAKRQKPAGWRMTPQSVIEFICGDRTAECPAKFVGERTIVECCVVALATQRGLMLVGEPGTAKSLLSELLSAAISFDSTLTIQGSAGTTDDAIKYSWNYALLLAEGPSDRSLVPAPVYQGMKEGRIVRFEELTRCPIEVQDSLLSVLSDRVMMIPELTGEGKALFSRPGFNIIATANIRDRGVNEMSAALKRRFNFVTIPPIRDINQEMKLVRRESERLFSTAGITPTFQDGVLECLVTTFHELRRGRSKEGQSIEPLTTAMSTAEAVSVAYASGIHAAYYGDGTITGAHIVQHLQGTAFKDSVEDIKRFSHYLTHIVRNREGAIWQEMSRAGLSLL